MAEVNNQALQYVVIVGVNACTAGRIRSKSTLRPFLRVENFGDDDWVVALQVRYQVQDKFWEPSLIAGCYRIQWHDVSSAVP